jgi:hypothetical protein
MKETKMPIIVWLAGLPAGDAEAAQAAVKEQKGKWNDPLEEVTKMSRAILYGFRWSETETPARWCVLYAKVKLIEMGVYEDNT